MEGIKALYMSSKKRIGKRVIFIFLDYLRNFTEKHDARF